MDNIILQYNPWFLVLCLLLGLGYATILYFRKGNFKDKSKWLVFLLFFLRFITVSLISFLLLSPLFKSVVEQKSKAVIVLGQDFSASLKNVYSGEELDNIKAAVSEIKNQFGDKYDVQEFSIGEGTTPGFRDSFDYKSTNLSSFFNYLNESYDDNELAAVFLSSDGIYNEGTNPVYINKKFNAPVYTLALGDTTVKKDLMVDFVYYNDIVFLGDKIAIKADIKATNAKGNTVNAVLYEIDNANRAKLLKSEKLKIDNDDYFADVLFVVEPKQAGVMHYRISLPKLKDEDSYGNNQKDIFVEVIDSRVRVLVYANNPHPDIAAYKDLLLQNKNYEVDIKYSGDRVQIKNYDLIIYFNLPSNTDNVADIHKLAIDNNISELFVTGTATDLKSLQEYSDLFELKSNTSSVNEVQAKVNEDFNLFITDGFASKGLENFPPVIAPFGEYKVSPEAKVVLYQTINKIETKYPLIVVSAGAKNKSAVIFAYNIYKWRLYNYMQTGNFDVVSSLIGNVAQYLTVKRDKSQWRVHATKNMFYDTENITFKAELYNASFQLINEPEAYMKIRNKDKEYDYVFSREDNYYLLNIDNIPAGNYTYEASVKYNGKRLSKKGKFQVVSKDLEKYDLLARHDILYKLASNSGGKMLSGTKDIGVFVDDIKAKDIKPVIYNTEKTSKVMDFKLLFWLLLLLLSIEWFIRRYNGSF